MSGFSNFFTDLWKSILRLFGASSTPQPPPAPPPDTIWTASFPFDNSDIVVSVDARFGGAIYSLTWKGVQFVNTDDHGREIQTAFQLDGLGEAVNPTEAGSAADAAGPTSSSIVNSAVASGNQITTTSIMAYWLPASAIRSTYSLSKTITLGWAGIANVIRDDITVVGSEYHSSVSIEGLTGYLGAQFTSLYEFDPSTEQLTNLPYTPSSVFDPSKIVGSSIPIILATPTGDAAMGIYSPTVPVYQAWMGAGGDSMKWDAAVHSVVPFPAGRYSWTVYMVVGTLAQVKQSLSILRHTEYILRHTE